MDQKLIDNHCHLDFPQYDEDRTEVIARNKDKLHAVVNAGSDHAANQRALELATEYPDFIYPCIGAHPTKIDAIGNDGFEQIKASIETHAEDIIAVGETGLDYHHDTETEKRERQETFFKDMLSIAEELDLPIVIHSRDAEKRCLELLETYELSSVIMHCFNGNMDQVGTAVGRGYWISISTQVLYSTRVKNIAETTPSDRIMLETDAPFLYPGEERNEPWRIHESLEAIASIKDQDQAALAPQFNENTRNAYDTAF
ncbi:MAG: TatD family hydrolase [Candidatus Nanohaloarchaeota archaeon QJJ-5]|nr:TatD family hydrolase [Candidatus Nanohaloarchaeota archaeon QJJ-5]